MTTETTTTTAEDEIKEHEAQDIASRINLDVKVVRAALMLGIDEEKIKEAYNGEFTSDEEFAQEIADELELMNDNNLSWPYTCIDWEWAARELMMDYCEHDGYYFRNL